MTPKEKEEIALKQQMNTIKKDSLAKFHSK